MKYCPICDKKLKPDGRCSCGWDPSLDYESYLTLGRIKTGEMSIHAKRNAHVKKLMDAQKKAYEGKIKELNGSKKSDASGDKVPPRKTRQNSSKIMIAAIAAIVALGAGLGAGLGAMWVTGRNNQEKTSIVTDAGEAGTNETKEPVSVAEVSPVSETPEYESSSTVADAVESSTKEMKEPVSVEEVSSVNETSKYARNNCNYEDIDPKDAGITDIFNMDFSTFPTNSEEQEGIWNYESHYSDLFSSTTYLLSLNLKNDFSKGYKDEVVDWILNQPGGMMQSVYKADGHGRIWADEYQFVSWLFSEGELEFQRKTVSDKHFEGVIKSIAYSKEDSVVPEMYITCSTKEDEVSNGSVIHFAECGWQAAYDSGNGQMQVAAKNGTDLSTYLDVPADLKVGDKVSVDLTTSKMVDDEDAFYMFSTDGGDKDNGYAYGRIKVERLK